MDETEYLLSSKANAEHLARSIAQARVKGTLEFNPNTYPTLPLRSRNSREGRYVGTRSGRHIRVSDWLFFELYEYPLSLQVKPLNRKQRKAEKLAGHRL